MPEDGIKISALPALPSSGELDGAYPLIIPISAKKTGEQPDTYKGTPIFTGSAAGGDLTGNYPNPTIASNAVTTSKIINDAVTTAKILDANVTTAKILDANVTAAKLATDSVTTAKLLDGAVTKAKLSATGGTNGQVLGLTGGALAWVDQTGGGGSGLGPVFLATPVVLANGTANTPASFTTLDIAALAPAVPASALALILRTRIQAAQGPITIQTRKESGSPTLDIGSAGSGTSADPVTTVAESAQAISSSRTIDYQLVDGGSATSIVWSITVVGYFASGTDNSAAVIFTGTAALPTTDGLSNGVNIAHGLGYVPAHVRVVLRCTDNTNVQGYALNQELDLSDANANNVALHPAYHVVVTSTNITVFKATAGNSPTLVPADGTNNSTLDPTKWQLKAYWSHVDGAVSYTVPTGVSQVLQAVKQEAVTISSATATGWYDITGLSLSITPPSASSKVVLSGVVNIGGLYSHRTGIRLLRGGSVISAAVNNETVTDVQQGTAACQGNGYGYEQTAVPFEFLDSPASGSAQTYKVQVYHTTGADTYVNKAYTEDATLAGHAMRTVSVLTAKSVT